MSSMCFFDLKNFTGDHESPIETWIETNLLRAKPVDAADAVDDTVDVADAVAVADAVHVADTVDLVRSLEAEFRYGVASFMDS